MSTAYDLRSPLRRWFDPHRRPLLVALSILWFAVGLTAEIVAVVAYGWRAHPIRHAWHAVSWLIFCSWILFGHHLHRTTQR